MTQSCPADGRTDPTGDDDTAVQDTECGHSIVEQGGIVTVDGDTTEGANGKTAPGKNDDRG